MNTLVTPCPWHQGEWAVTLPPLELHLTSAALRDLIRWMDSVGCDVGLELGEGIAHTIEVMLPLSPAGCRWAGCQNIGTHRCTVNTVNGDTEYDLCNEHYRLVVP